MPELDPFAPLLADDEPGAFEVLEDDGGSPFFLVCDHAARRIPRALGSLGLSEAELETHIAWDVGAAGVARRLAALLGGFLILQRYSRLVIDCNRPLTAPDSIAKESERIPVPGNQAVSRAEAELRAKSIYHPYHDRIRAELERREQARRPTILVTVHTFTPVYLGVARPWHVGVLYNRDARLAARVLTALRSDPEWVVGDNQPYRVTDHSDVAVMEYGERRNNLHVELEVRQDLVADESGQRAWGERLATILRDAVRHPSQLEAPGPE
jgi:predicted N-formylglutamate amidohydrolase